MRLSAPKTLSLVGLTPKEIYDSHHPQVKVLGALNRNQLIEVYKRASVLIHPSWYDPFPSVILEAANFEIPAVASRVCGIPEMIREGQTGYVVDPKDTFVFSQRIILLLKDKARLMALGKEAKSYVREKFHPKIVASRMKSVMEPHMKGKSL